MTTAFEIPIEESVRVLKQVLPLMSKQRVPTIPQNYAVWYDYVTHRNVELVSEIENRLARGESFNPHSCQRIYEKYFLDDLHAEVDGIQGAVRVAVESALAELSELGHDISHFALFLDDCSESLSDEPTQDDLNRLVTELAKETQATRARSAEVEGSLNAMADELNEMREQVNRLSRDSRTDALTGVANRRAFDEALNRLTREARESRQALCMVLVDVDNFKAFNDKHGHLTGDRVLRAVAQEMEQCVKGRDMLARYGGEEFALLLPSTPLAGAMMLAESIRAIIQVQDMRDHQGGEVDRVTISLGVAQFQPDDDFCDFVERADACLYRSKSAGRNRVTGPEA